MRIRQGTTNDVAAISKVFAESWRTTYAGLAPDVFVNGMTENSATQIFLESLQSTEHAYFLHAAETDEGRLVGFIDGGKDRSHPESGIGEIYAIYLLKDFQRQGLGRQLWQAATQSLVASGIQSVLVWVLESSMNHRFYLSLGGKLLNEVKSLQVGPHEIRLVGYFWQNLK